MRKGASALSSEDGPGQGVEILQRQLLPSDRGREAAFRHGGLQVLLAVFGQGGGEAVHQGFAPQQES